MAISEHFAFPEGSAAKNNLRDYYCGSCSGLFGGPRESWCGPEDRRKLFPEFGLELPVAQILRDLGAFLVGLAQPHLDGLDANGLLKAGRINLDALVEEVSGCEEAGHARESIVEVVERVGVHRIRAMEFLDANHVSHRVPLSCAVLRVAAD